MAAVRKLLEWDFASYEDETNDEYGIGSYDRATGKWKSVDGCL